MQTPPEAQSGSHALSNGAKIGIIIGITVVVILCVVAVTLCAFDMKRRVKRKQAERENRDAELNMLANELRSGRTRQRDKRSSRSGGLWEGLKIGRMSEEIGKERANPDAKARQGSYGVWERVGETRNQEAGSIRKDSTLGTEREHEWLPAYVPRERGSIVSSVGSMGFPLPPKPVMVKSYPAGEDKR